MPRGGKRKGAGRKRHLKAQEILWCWEECSRLFAEARCRREIAYWQQFENGPDFPKLRELQARLNSLPISERVTAGAIYAANTANDEALDEALDQAAYNGDEAASLLLDIRTEADDIGRQARHLTKGRSCSLSLRAHKFPRAYPSKRAKNTPDTPPRNPARSEIFAQVSRDASKEFDRRITKTEVEENWKRRRDPPKP